MAQSQLNCSNCDRQEKEIGNLRHAISSLSKHIDAYELQTEELTDIPSAVSRLFIKNLRRVMTRIDMPNDSTLDTPQLHVTTTNGQVDFKKKGKRKNEDSFDEQQQEDEEEESVVNNNDGSRSSNTSSTKARPRSRSRSISSSSSSTSSTKRVQRLGAKNTQRDEFRTSLPPSSPRNKSPTKKAAKMEPSPQKKKRSVVDDERNVIGEEFCPPKWLSDVIPKRAPYFPQLGDDLVYFRQGHELYTKMVEELQVYAISKMMKKQLPFVQHTDLPPEVSVRVVKINYELLPPRLVNLKLARTNWETGELIGGELLVRYHDMSDVMDFLVPRQIYEKAVDYHWNVGDRFRHLSKADHTWWLGTVSAPKPFNPEFVDSNLLCYEVTWDDRDNSTDDPDGGKSDNLSPWDMEPISDEFGIGTPSRQEDDCSTDDVGSFVYISKPDDWSPSAGQNDSDERERILTLFQGVMDLPIASHFLNPMDLKKYPAYAFAVEYPIDLSTIKARLHNCFYRRADSVSTDIDHIFINANKFSLPVDDYVKNAKIVRDLLTEILKNKEFEDVDEAYDLALENYNKEVEEIVNKDLNGKGRCDDDDSAAKTNVRPSKTSTQKPGLGKKSTPTTNKKDPETTATNESWSQDCQKLLQAIWSKGNAAPFRYPVSTIDYPDYLDVINTPMCLNVVKENLKSGTYTSPVEFHKDMMLIFQNSHNYHPDPQSAIRAMTFRLQSSYEEEYHKVFRDQSKPTPFHTPAKTKKAAAASGKKDSEVTSVGNPAESPLSRQESKNGSNRRLSGRQVKDKVDYSGCFSEKVDTCVKAEKNPKAKRNPASRKPTSPKKLAKNKKATRTSSCGVKKSSPKKSKYGSEDESSDPDIIILE